MKTTQRERVQPFCGCAWLSRGRVLTHRLALECRYGIEEFSARALINQIHWQLKANNNNIFANEVTRNGKLGNKKLQKSTNPTNLF